VRDGIVRLGIGDDPRENSRRGGMIEFETPDTMEMLHDLVDDKFGIVLASRRTHRDEKFPIHYDLQGCMLCSCEMRTKTLERGIGIDIDVCPETGRRYYHRSEEGGN
jgi:hypothetical protein